MTEQKPLWTPHQASVDATNMARFMARVNAQHGLERRRLIISASDIEQFIQHRSLPFQ